MYILFAGLMIAAIAPVAKESPNRQPQLAVSGNRVALAFGSGKSILLSYSNDGGASFAPPSRIAELPVLALGRHRGPRVAFAGSTIVVTAIGGASVATGPHAHGLPSDGDLIAWRSSDGGRTWSKPVTVNDVPAAAREGLHAMAADDRGNVAAIWLDLRSEGTRLYGALSRDSGATWSPNFEVYKSPGGTICQCCHPSLLAMGNGEFAVMFRNALDGNRDMYTLRLRDGKVVDPASKLGRRSWQLNACPMDGGGIAAASGNVVTAWRRDKQIYLAAPGEDEQLLGNGKDVALAASGDHVFAVWTDGAGIQSWTSGRAAMLSPEGAFPVVAPLSGGRALAAWEEKGAISIRTLE